MSYKNESEKYVARMCEKSFLSLWSYANPRGKNGKELCDILVVFDPYILIFSVKEKTLKESSKGEIVFKRWYKKAIKKSYEQIYGAERWIKKAKSVVKNNGEEGLPFPDLESRKIHRIAIALGGKDKVFIPFGDFGKGFVHVFDEESMDIVMGELDTITDFIDYLNFKEDLHNKCDINIMGGEENLLAYYLQDSDELLKKATSLIISDNLWENLKNKIEYKNKKSADKISYLWDKMIEQLINDLKLGRIEFSISLDDMEIALRTMAAENRFDRRLLIKRFKELIVPVESKKIRARMCPSYSGIIYVFLVCNRTESREIRRTELFCRCIVTRGLYKDSHTIVGIATEWFDGITESSIDLIHLYINKLTSEQQSMINDIQSEFGYFKNARETKINEEEYPTN